MPFDKYMDQNQVNLKLYHWLLRQLPTEFTEKQAEAVIQQRYALSKATEYEVKTTIMKMRKLKMIGSKNIKNTYQETVYFIRDLYCRHYKKGKYSRTNGVIHD